MSNFNFIKAVRQTPMPPTTKLVAITLATYADYETGECYPSIQTLMADTGLSNRAVIAHIKNIEKLGILIADRSNGRRSYYRFDMENLTKAVTQGHSSGNQSSDFHDKSGDSDDSEPVTFTHEAVTLTQKAVTQGHTNIQEQPLELRGGGETPEQKNSQNLPPPNFVQFHNFDLAKITVIELDQKYSTLKTDFIELAQPRNLDLEFNDFESLFFDFGDWFSSHNDLKQISVKTAQKWAVAWLGYVQNNKHKIIARKAKMNASEQSSSKQQVSAQPSAFQAKQENVNRWLRYGQRVREEQQQGPSIIDVVSEPPKNFLIEEVGHA